MSTDSISVSVVIPIHKPREELTADEEISLKHLMYFLGRFDKYLVVPQSFKADFQGFGIKRFPDKCFKTALAYNRLLISRRFYEAFIDYEYILIYQLDSLAFSDQLIQWCKLGYDYIGAPWLKSNSQPNKGFSKVGNGGFSLRKIESFLKVIDSPRHLVELEKYWDDFCVSQPKYVQYLYSSIPRKLLKRLKFFNSTKWYMSQYFGNEDLFWSYEAVKFYPDFKVAPVEVGLRFAFECAPRYCFEQNNYTLPFGCHAWSKWDKDFWKPYLLKQFLK